MCAALAPRRYIRTYFEARRKVGDMTLSETLQLLQTASVVLAIIVAAYSLKDRGDDKTVQLTKMSVDISYIKQQVSKMDPMQTDVTKALSSAASAHHRLNDHIRYEHHKDPEYKEE